MSKETSTSISMRVTISVINKKFSSVQSITTDTLANWLNDDNLKDKLLVLDARAAEEHKLSKIQNAIIVSETGNDLDDTFNRLNTLEKNENDKLKVVCFCSVGYRSSSYIEKLTKYIKEKDNNFLKHCEMFNLAGGIFKWINEGYTVFNNENQITDICHPYNKIWGKLLNKKNLPTDS